MTFSAYIQRQKSLIRSRNGGSPIIINFMADSPTRRDIILPEYDTKALLDELNSLKGLNTAERQRYSKKFSKV